MSEVKGNHYVISDECRATHGDGEGVVDETLGRLREEMLRTLRGRPMGQGAKLHIRFSVERGTQPVKAVAEEQSWHLVDGVPHCNACGYNARDCALHLDHHLCPNPDPPEATDAVE